MTEHDWQTCADPEPMLEFLRGAASDRKLRLFACACFRGYVWGMLNSPEDHLSQAAVVTAEEYADGLASRAALQAGLIDEYHMVISSGFAPVSQLQDGVNALCGDDGVECALEVSKRVALTVNRTRRLVAMRQRGEVGWPSDAVVQEALAAQREEERRHCGLLRDTFGNPTRPVTVDRHCISPGAVAVARSVYGARDFADLPVLADALEDAGCADDAILGHCRGGGEHVRGCWAVDLVLGLS